MQLILRWKRPQPIDAPAAVEQPVEQPAEEAAKDDPGIDLARVAEQGAASVMSGERLIPCELIGNLRFKAAGDDHIYQLDIGHVQGEYELRIVG